MNVLQFHIKSNVEIHRYEFSAFKRLFTYNLFYNKSE